jgi:hypothetical protein
MRAMMLFVRVLRLSVRATMLLVSALRLSQTVRACCDVAFECTFPMMKGVPTPWFYFGRPRPPPFQKKPKLDINTKT